MTAFQTRWLVGVLIFGIGVLLGALVWRWFSALIVVGMLVIPSSGTTGGHFARAVRRRRG
jgi:hypothetical protein